MKHFYNQKWQQVAWRAGGLVLLDGLLFGGTDSQKVKAWLLVAGILLAAANIYYILRALSTLLKLYGLRFKRERRLIAALSGILTGLLALQSIGAFGAHDFIVFLPLVLLGYFYASYSLADKRQAD